MPENALKKSVIFVTFREYAGGWLAYLLYLGKFLLAGAALWLGCATMLLIGVLYLCLRLAWEIGGLYTRAVYEGWGETLPFWVKSVLSMLPWAFIIWLTL